MARTPYIPKEKPAFPYDRPLSHSQLTTFQWSKQKWYDKYVLGFDSPVTREMEFGSMVDKRIQEDPTYLPQVPRLTHLQYPLKCEYEGIPLIGFPDSLDLDNPHLRDTKTGRQIWNKRRADETKQLTMYLTMIYLIHKIKPEEFKCAIDWLPTRIHEGEVCFTDPVELVQIETKRTMTDVLKFLQYIVDTRKEMEEYYRKQTHIYTTDFFAK